MLAFELSNHDFRRIWLYYVARKEADAVYDEEIRNSYLDAESYIDYELWLTGRRRPHHRQRPSPTRSRPSTTMPSCSAGRAAFVRDLARQFRALGLPSEPDHHRGAAVPLTGQNWWFLRELISSRQVPFTSFNSSR